MRYRIKTGNLAFILQRITGLGLSIFLFIHVIGKKFIIPDKMLFTLILFLFLIHGLNGIRLIIIDLGWMVEKQKQLFWFLMVTGLLVWGYLIV